MNWKENPTTQGLNDLATSNGGVRGVFPSYGAWIGKSAATQDIALQWWDSVLIAGNCIVGQTHYRNGTGATRLHELWAKGCPSPPLRRANSSPLRIRPTMSWRGI